MLRYLEARLLRSYREPMVEAYSRISATASPGRTAIAGLSGIEIDLARVLG